VNWKPPADKDVAVKAWMKAKGLKVDETDCDGRQGVYFWIHFPKRGRPLILGISREAIDDTPLFVVQELLNRLNVATELKARAGAARVLVRRNDAFVLEDFARE
jgi:hypothetical protein